MFTATGIVAGSGYNWRRSWSDTWQDERFLGIASLMRDSSFHTCVHLIFSLNFHTRIASLWLKTFYNTTNHFFLRYSDQQCLSTYLQLALTHRVSVVSSLELEYYVCLCRNAQMVPSQEGLLPLYLVSDERKFHFYFKTIFRHFYM